MRNQQWLTVGASTLIAGTLLSLALPSTRSIAIIAASTAGAVGGTLLTRSKKSPSSKAVILEPSNQQIIHSLARLENLLIENKTELLALKKQLNGVKTIPRQSPSAPASILSSSDSDPIETSLITETEIVSEQEIENASKIVNWLTARNLTVESYKEPQETDVIFDKVARYLGRQYTILKSFHRQLKFNINKGGKFTFRLTERSKEDINQITSFCRLLNERSFLPCRYFSSQKIIIASPPTNPNMINFFTGDWFELFVYQQICDLLLDQAIPYVSIRQITGTFENGRNFELDLLFLINDQPLWVECKAGRDYNEYLTRYTHLRERMRIPKEKAFLVIADLTSEQANDYTNLWQITVASIDNFIELISHSLGIVSSQEPQQVNAKEGQPLEIPKTGKSQLLKFLDKKSLHPLPEYRGTIIFGLTELFKNSNQSITIYQIKEILSESIQISKSKISDVIRALMRSGCFLSQTGETIPSYTTSISSLVSLDPIILEQKCIETYATEVLAVNQNYFDDPSNRQEFQETTGGEVPDIETIRRLLEKEEIEIVEDD